MNKKVPFQIIVFLALILFATPVLADTPAANVEKRTYSSSPLYLIDMKPSGGWGGYGPGEGIVYRARVEGDEELWRVDFYSSDVVLTEDGKYLIAFGPWATETSDLAIAFYKEGQELKSYQVGDLISNERNLVRTVSHFFWRARRPEKIPGEGLSPDGRIFQLTLLDRTVYVFDVTTGEVLEPKNYSDTLGIQKEIFSASGR